MLYLILYSVYSYVSIYVSLLLRIRLVSFCLHFLFALSPYLGLKIKFWLCTQQLLLLVHLGIEPCPSVYKASTYLLCSWSVSLNRSFFICVSHNCSLLLLIPFQSYLFFLLISVHGNTRFVKIPLQ